MSVVQVTPHSLLVSVSQGTNVWYRGGKQPLHDHFLVFICQTSSESSMSLPTVAKAPFLFPLFPHNLTRSCFLA